VLNKFKTSLHNNTPAALWKKKGTPIQFLNETGLFQNIWRKGIKGYRL